MLWWLDREYEMKRGARGAIDQVYAIITTESCSRATHTPYKAGNIGHRSPAQIAQHTFRPPFVQYEPQIPK